MEEQQYDTDLLGDRSRGYSSSLDKCACTVTANGTVYLESTVEFRTDPDVQQTNDTCGPLLKFQYDKVGRNLKRSVASYNHNKVYFVCILLSQ